MTTVKHTPLVVTPRTTRQEIQAEIGYYRTEQRRAVIPSTAREHADHADGYLDALLERQAEPV